MLSGLLVVVVMILIGTITIITIIETNSWHSINVGMVISVVVVTMMPRSLTVSR